MTARLVSVADFRRATVVSSVGFLALSVVLPVVVAVWIIKSSFPQWLSDVP